LVTIVALGWIVFRVNNVISFCWSHKFLDLTSNSAVGSG
jgi:hypothetical protein